MYLNDIVAQVQMRVWHDLYAHKHNEEEVAQVLYKYINDVQVGISEKEAYSAYIYICISKTLMNSLMWVSRHEGRLKKYHCPNIALFKSFQFSYGKIITN
jgi:hypothetical protein